jgi:radical SAM protein with 4Fe4S-binding SPASM domain
MSREQYRNLADQLREAGTIFVMFTGGEAFLRPDIIEIMSDYHQKGFALELKTNGTLMDPKTIDCLRTLNIYNLQVSIYGLENGYSDLLSANYNFEGLSENIKIAIQAGLPIGLAVLVGKHNIDQLDRYHEVLTNLGVNDIFYSPYITPNRSGGIGFESAIRLSRSEMENKLLPFLYRIGGLSNPTKYRDCNCDGPICFAGHDQIAISPGGTIYPCLDFQLKLGNMLEDDLNSILARRKDILSQYTLGKMSKCMKCNIVEFCDSCPGTALLEHGDYAVPSLHKCDVSQFNLRTLIKEKGGDN